MSLNRTPLNPKIDITRKSNLQKLILDLNLQMDDLVGAVNRTLPYESSPQTITAAGALTLSHGLGTKPRRYAISLICGTAELGYSIGDEVFVSSGMSIVGDAYNISIRYDNTASTFSVQHKTTGALTGITNANWTMKLRAWV